MIGNVPRVLALGPSGVRDLGLAVAASRAGGLGIWDWGLGCDLVEASATVRAAERYLGARVLGLRMPADEVGSAEFDALPACLQVVIATAPADGDWTAAIGAIGRSGRTALAEVTTRGSASKAARAGAAGLIVAGNEAGGRGGDDSSFILLQAVAGRFGVPVWVRGGIGPRVAAACVAAGAAGVVLDGALLLARETALDEDVRARLGRWDGGETQVLGRNSGRPLRLHALPGAPVLARLKEADAAGPEAWRVAVRALVGWGPGQAWPVGQDSAWAASLARRFVTVGGIVQAVDRAIDEGIASARRARPLASGSALAVSHGTRYPIVQGPMTRVSDTAAFAEAVAEGGGLPFLALALMRGPEVRTLLTTAAERLAGRSWGVGVLGFVPPELRLEQIEEVRKARPPFALIAGGRPDQARALEQDGITTYLHVPSPGLLRQYLNDGARRFVLEGRECGGHVGPRSSFVLWEQAAEVLDEALDRGLTGEPVHLLFAGGIHDARSAAAVAALIAPLAERGVRAGVLIGTAYLFTVEAVATGAIVPGFQAEALRCDRTVLLETGPGHEVRVSPTPFADVFESERARLLASKRPAEEVRVALEGLNAGRLRVASKGIERSNGSSSPLVAVAEPDQTTRGLYMLGQAATLRDGLTTIAELHRTVADESAAMLERLPIGGAAAPRPRSQPSDIAIVGMSAIVPGAADARTFWENTLRGTDAIEEIPADRWDWRLYYDADPKAPDKIISKWGGFIPDVPFDPLRYGMPPTSLPSIEPLHLLTLEAVRAALDDAGYRDRPFPRERTAVVLGAGGGAAQLAMGYAFRSFLPMLDTVVPGAGTEAMERCGPYLPEWTEDSFPGILLNVAAGRVANRFDLGGANYTVDAACGSSLAAAALAVRELESGAADMVILGGADTVQNAFTYLAFSKTHAFSPRGRCRPFDASADGIVISEAVAVVVLKRLTDAERDGDRIYAVIKGLGAGSDGRAKGLTAPRPEGQSRALRRAYEKADVSPATIGYVEAHGTGTAAGDLSEFQALTAVFQEAGAEPTSCALGSIKSQIGHTKCAAGLAGLINATLALYHQVLPPTIGVERPNPRVDLDASPFRISTKTRPWLHPYADRPRRAGVSAFGFGGTNFHAVLEAYDRDPIAARTAPAAQRDWPAELLVWRAETREALSAGLDGLARALDSGARPALRDLAETLLRSTATTGPALAITARTLDDLRAKLERARRALAEGLAEFHDPRGIDFAERPTWQGAKVAFLFPGQGAQRTEMLAELAAVFPEVRQGYEAIDAALVARGRRPVGPIVFPPPAFSDADRARQHAALAAAEVAQPALAGASVGVLRLLSAFGIKPDVTAGHSFGELVALHAAGALTVETLAELAEARGRFLNAAVGDEPGAMAAVAVGPEGLGAVLDGLDGVGPANWNGPGQTVITGTRPAVEQAVARARQQGLRAQLLLVACAFHSERVAGASAPLVALARGLDLRAPGLPVYSNVTAAPHANGLAEGLGTHLARPVRFAEMIAAMYADGARVFIEVGPGATLSALVGPILEGRPHLAAACDPSGRPGLAGLLPTLGRLFVAGVPITLDRLTAGRAPRRLDPIRFVPEDTPEALPASAWLVNGTRSRPARGAEPVRLGPGPALPIPPPRAETAARPAPPVPLAVPVVGAEGVLDAFNRNMQRFLEVQRETMVAYLSGQPTSAPPANPIRIETPAPSQPAPEPATSRPNPPAPAPAPEKSVARQGVAEHLLGIVRDRTGYPAEMLELNLDLEADLGIDSIKRVEILGSLRDVLPDGPDVFDSDLMDQLSRARTLGAIVEKIGKALTTAGKSATAAPRSSVAVSGPVRRLVLEPVPAPLSREARSAGLAEGGILLVTDDGRGIARALAFDLRARGYPVVRVRHDGGGSNGHAAAPGRNGDDEHADLTSPADVAALLDRVRARGRLAGLVHVLPLRDSTLVGLDPAAWSARLAPEARGLFLLAREAAEDLNRAAEQGGACLIAATGLGGAFASVGELPPSAFPGHGAVAGLVKTLGHEWPGVRSRVVDFDPLSPFEIVAANLVHEVFADDRRTEVGYLDRRRVTLRAVAAELPEGQGRGVRLETGAPVIVTGGARGITAAVCADLARRWRPTLLLLGTSPPPPDREAVATAGVEDPARLKSLLLERLTRSGAPVAPTELERTYQALRREREIRGNLRALREAGSLVEYVRADVRDRETMRRTISDWRARHGPIAGLIHGAGIIQDKLLRDKSTESFDRVLGTKFEGAVALANLLDGEPLRFAAFFSSVAGRFGNRGQSDYAAANEALNKLAIWLDRRWAARVVSMIWGPWSGVGMVSDLEAHLGRRGLGMIPPEDGRSRLGDELERGRKGEVEIIVAGELGSLQHNGSSHAPAVTLAKAGSGAG